MAEEEVPVAVLIWLGCIFVASVVAWSGKRDWLEPRSSPPAMEMKMLDYMIFIWVLFMTFFVIQSIYALSAPADSAAEAEDVYRAWPLVLGSLSLQIPLLVVTLIALGSSKLPFAHPKLNVDEGRISDEIWFGSRAFLMALPVIWISTAIWRAILHGLSQIVDGIPMSSQLIVDTVAQDVDLIPILILTFIGVVMAPVAEELFFRGSVFRFLKSKLSLAAAAWISAVLFALMHANLAAMLPLILVGWFLAQIYERRGSIAACITFHAAFNAQSFVILFMTRAAS